jgi:DNA-binding GntR family transcriptional regulator
MVDDAVDAIIAGAARGLILPGDRIVETEIAQKLGISRVPVREALRLLESQGIVISAPYKGIRLTPVTQERLDQVLDVRVALEARAARRVVELGRNKDKDSISRLERSIDELELMATRQDAYGFAQADVEFHRTLCQLGGNEYLCTLWEGVSRQLTIVVGLSTLEKPMQEIIQEHQFLLASILGGDLTAIEAALEDHIRGQNAAIDYEKLVSRHRRR